VPRERGHSTASFRLSFEPFEVAVKLMFGNPLAAFQFFNARTNLRVNRLPVSCELFVLFVQHL